MMAFITRKLLLIFFILPALAFLFFLVMIFLIKKPANKVQNEPGQTQQPGQFSEPTRFLSPTPTPEPTKVSKKAFLKWGAYTGWEAAKVTEFENKVGRRMDYIGSFVHWGNESEFPEELAQLAKKEGKTMVIYWEAMDYNNTSAEDPRFTYDSIISGRHDQYITSFAAAAKTYGGPVILIPFEEMNGNWYPWSGIKNTNSYAKHIEAYRYLRLKFKNITNVKFAWDINVESEPDIPDNAIEKYYPGDQYVDYVGVNGFNFGEPWQLFGEIFDSALNKLTVYRKPIVIFSMACAQGSTKPAWIKNAVEKISLDSRITGFIWFNENKEKDWRVWSDNNSLKSFQESLTSVLAR
jgi:hypothetical protein